jgi:hypothetical protein
LRSGATEDFRKEDELEEGDKATEREEEEETITRVLIKGSLLLL